MNNYYNYFRPQTENAETETPSAADTPVIPLPNPGEGGPVYSGGENDNDSMPENIPVIPLPNPGEGGPVYSGGNNNMNQGGSNIGQIPLIPLPNPGEGGPVYSDSIITVLPRPVTPCFYCNSTSYGTLRFLNAAINYNPFVISVNNRTVVDTLAYGEVSEYGRVSSGYQTIIVSGTNGYIYISKQIRITPGSKSTVAIVNTAGGLDFTVINDVACQTPFNASCLRACNLSYNSGPLTVMSSNNNIVFQNLSYLDVSEYSRLIPGRYDLYVSNTRQVLVSTELTARANSQYTLYLFNWNQSPDAIRTLIIEDRK